jgi:small subunit ribosomal protein S16
VRCSEYLLIEEIIVAVTLRLARHGQKKRPFYRIVAAEKAARRDGRFLEIVGTYNPMTVPATISLKEEAVKRWVAVGAQTSQTVRDILIKNLPGVIEVREAHQLEKLQAKRKARKQRIAARK